jgi:hypothetical protein
MTATPAPSPQPPAAPAAPHPLEAALAGIAAVLFLGLATAAAYHYASVWLPAQVAWPSPAAALNAAGLAAFCGVLAFFYGLDAVLKQRLVLALGFAWRERRGGLRGMAAVTAGAGGAVGGLLLAAAALLWLLPDLSLPLHPAAAVLAGLLALVLGWLLGLALRRLGY